MDTKKGISLIALIITIAVLIIIAGVTIQNGMQRTEEAKLANHNTNISTTQEEVESFYYYKGGELPAVDMTPYDVTAHPTLLAEITKNGEDTDTFYILDLSKLGKVAGKEGTGVGNDIYIVSATRHNVYYVKGSKIKGVTYHGLTAKGDVQLAQIATPTPGGATSTPTTAPSYEYNNPKIPNGFNYVSGTWDDGYTIQDGNGNQFVWVPVGNLPADGTLDGTNFNSKFGRRNFKGDTFGTSNYYETNDTNLQNMTASVNTYGGFYIAKYEASNNGGKAESKDNKAPWASINWNNAKTAAEAMDAGWDSSVESYLCYGAHWDTALKWIIYSTEKTEDQVINDSKTWGNYNNDSFSGTIEIGNTGQWAQTCARGIYDLGGNVWEWSMENYTSSSRVYRGGGYVNAGDNGPAAFRYYYSPTDNHMSLGFRTTLYLK